MLSKMESEIISNFPRNVKEDFLKVPEDVLKCACEIRFRVGQPGLISCFQEEFFLSNKISTEDILRLIENFSDNSIYSIQNEMNSGFITIKGGHRIGISGTSIFENGIIKNMKYISSLNIRIAREVKNCGVDVLNQVLKNHQGNFENTLIVSPPRLR
ncbi:MAG: hypothetical protein IJ215_02040 [Clostridia bacterium]|nr:hypothetical protein [Clostridia bacterium]